jgi:DNA-binding CsgD family transcriptional regulator
MDLAHRCGSAALAERARTELLACGSRPRGYARSGRDALTASELRVARMAADGMTNREIAQALFITIRTVTTHLGHAYEKLGISGREQLAAELAERS